MRRDFKPWGYQDIIIARQLAAPRINTWAGMGMGKTCSTLTTIDALQLAGEGPALILAPKRVAQSTWPDEALKWSHLAGHTVVPVLGDPGERARALKRDASVFTINYDNLPWLIEHLGVKRWPFPIVVADESTRLKSFRLRQGGKRAGAIARIAHTGARHWINLTGTPSPNGLQDLWGQNWFIDAGVRLGRTYSAFQQRWFVPERRGNVQSFTIWTPADFAQEQIETKMRDVTVSVQPRDWFPDLREPIIKEVKVDLPSKVRVLYRDMEKQMFMQIDEIGVEAVHAAARTIKCLQLASGAVIVDEDEAWREVHDEKLQALESIIEEASGAPILVAYHFKSDLVRLKRAFPKGRELDSSPATIRDWNAGRISLLFAHPQSAGHGLNLQDGGNIIVYFSQWWNLEEHDQIMERIGAVRQLQAGYDRPTFIYYIVARDTVDETVMLRRTSKRSVQDLLLEAMKARGYG